MTVGQKGTLPVRGGFLIVVTHGGVVKVQHVAVLGALPRDFGLPLPFSARSGPRSGQRG